ncbi:hypothetical protein [uncultured Altererythrobacter sp.]|uniref:hypothetical protein n=1 Tax=uncultured Altererythrobacter sp. TaxID=500840 RepID=UPI0025E9978C|nr:hypothetical protein [uncultured Altererythrobacter sp.]
MKRLATLCKIGFAGMAFATSPAAAQDEAGDRVNMVIAYDENECPEPSNDEEIVVCQILVEAERYRIPSNLRTSSSPENTPWAERVERFKMIGAFGAMSCSPAGAGGFTGCTQQMIDAAYADKEASTRVRFSQLIEQARQDRLSNIDVDAAAEQDRVEQIEREYLERLEHERQQALPGEENEAPLPGLVPENLEGAPEEPNNG